jgi:putative ABC transport system permease protein
VLLDLYDRTEEFTVVGVAADMRMTGSSVAPSREGFASFWQEPSNRFHLIVQAAPDARVTARSLSEAIASIDPEVPVGDITTLEAIASSAVQEPRFHMTLMAAFGLLAVVLSVIGCYGVLAFSVAQRTREIGVRAALGAQRKTILLDMIGHGASLIGAGLVTGTAMALAATRVLQTVLYGVSPTDPLTLAFAAVILASASFAAVAGPARRAASVSPLDALRE